MTIATKKKIAWVVFLVNLGSLLFFYYIFLANDAHKVPPRIIPWPVTSMLLGPFSALYLLRCYRLEPVKGPGHWHLSLSDFQIASFFSALCMALWHSTWPDSFIFWGAAVSVIGGIWLLMCLMVAEWRGFSKYATKLPLAIGLLLKSYGYLAWASLTAFIVLLAIFEGFSGVLEFWRDLIGVYINSDRFLYVTIYMSLPTLPIGWALCAFVLRKKKQDG